MNLNSPFLIPAFNGRTTSALSRIPSPFQAFPGGNIGYANRIEGVGKGLFGDIFGDVSTGSETVDRIINGVTEKVTVVADTYLDAVIGGSLRKARESAGYTFYGPIEISVNGVKKSGVKAQKPDGTWWVVFADGTEVAYTTDVQRTAVNIDPKTGLSTGAAVGISVAAVAVIALLLFLPRGRR